MIKTNFYLDFGMYGSESTEAPKFMHRRFPKTVQNNYNFVDFLANIWLYVEKIKINIRFQWGNRKNRTWENLRLNNNPKHGFTNREATNSSRTRNSSRP